MGRDRCQETAARGVIFREGGIHDVQGDRSACGQGPTIAGCHCEVNWNPKHLVTWTADGCAGTEVAPRVAQAGTVLNASKVRKHRVKYPVNCNPSGDPSIISTCSNVPCN